jgi:hypothetical protein
MNDAELQRLGAGYAAAWCSQSAASVAAFYEECGSLQINSGLPSVGRSSIASAAQSFMTAFPNMVVSMIDVSANGDGAVFRWILTGTNTGPGGTGKPVRISGYEQWRFGENGLVLKSKGHFDEADYHRQLAGVPDDLGPEGCHPIVYSGLR